MSINTATENPQRRKQWSDFKPFTPESLPLESEADGSNIPPEVVHLTHFSSKVIVEFGDHKPGKVVKRKLKIQNPHDEPLDVLVEKFPWKIGFRISEDIFTVEAGSNHVVDIIWQTNDSGRVRELVTLKYSERGHAQVVLVGKVNTPVKKTRKGRFRRTKGQPSFKEKINAAFMNKFKTLENSENVDPNMENTVEATPGALVPLRESNTTNKDGNVQATKSVVKNVLKETNNLNALRNSIELDHVEFPAQLLTGRPTFMKSKLDKVTACVFKEQEYSGRPTSVKTEADCFAPIGEKLGDTADEVIAEKEQFYNDGETSSVKLNKASDTCGRLETLENPDSAQCFAEQDYTGRSTFIKSDDKKVENLSKGLNQTFSGHHKPAHSDDDFRNFDDVVPNLSESHAETSVSGKKDLFKDFADQVSTGRPTFIIGATPPCLEVVQKEKRVRTKQRARSIAVDSPRRMTPRAHRRSRTYVVKDTQDSPMQVFARIQRKCRKSELARTTIKSADDSVTTKSPDELLEKALEAINRSVEYITPKTNDSLDSTPKHVSLNQTFEKTPVGSDACPAHDDGHGVGPLGGAVCENTAPVFQIESNDILVDDSKHETTEISPATQQRKRKSSDAVVDGNLLFIPLEVAEKVHNASPATYKSPAKRHKNNKPKLGASHGTPKGRALQRRRISKARGGEVAKPPVRHKKAVSPRTTKRQTIQSAPVVKKKTAKARSIKGVPMAKLVLAPKSQKTSSTVPRYMLPYSSGNMFYDESWRRKQESAFTAWLNYVLTPDEFKMNVTSSDVESTNEKKINTGANKRRTNLQILGMSGNLKPAINKETASLRSYRMTKRLNELRSSFCAMFHSQKTMDVLLKIEREVEQGRVAVRDDIHMWADLGNRQKILNWLLSFHPLWLRLGLEIVFGETMPLVHGNNDVTGMKHFILQRVLNCEEIANKYKHPTVPSLYLNGYKETLAKHTLKKFLTLLFLLDQAKSLRLIEHDPCLFNKDSEIKSTRSMLLLFSRDFLRGEGDITKHLSYIGYELSHEQTYIDEFEFGFDKIQIALKDGVRLCRVVEVLFHDWTLLPKLRVPAGSILQKKHNVSVALKALEKHNISIHDDEGVKIEADDIVKAHAEKTLSLLWNIVSSVQLVAAINVDLLKEEIAYLRNNIRLRNKLLGNHGKIKVAEDQPPTEGSPTTKIAEISALLLQWCELVCGLQFIPVHNFAASFCDGRALCSLISYYQPSLIKRSAIKMETTQSVAEHANGTSALADGEVQYETLVKNEKANFRAVKSAIYEMGGIPDVLKLEDMCNTIPDNKVVRIIVSFLFVRLLDISAESRAARKIQIAWRTYHARITKAREEIEQRKLEARSAVVIAKFFRRVVAIKRHRKRVKAATAIQSHWCSYMQTRKARRAFVQLRSHVIIMQSFARRFLARKQIEQLKNEKIAMIRKNQSVIVIQRYVRGWLSRRYERKKRAAMCIQAHYRGYLLMKREQERFAKIKRSVLVIQAWFRANKCGQEELQRYQTMRKAAVVIQTRFRAEMVQQQRRAEYLLLRQSAFKIQYWYRACRDRNIQQGYYLSLKNAVTQMQRQYRANKSMQLARDDFVLKKESSVLIQAWYKACLKRRLEQHSYQSAKKSVIVIQARFRAWKLMKQDRCEFLLLKASATYIQSWYRACVQRKSDQNLYTSLKKWVCFVQARFRANRLMRTARDEFNLRKASSIKIQRWYRACMHGHIARESYVILRSSVITIQRRFRANKSMKVARNDFMMKKKSAILIKAWYRACVARRAEQLQFQNLKVSAIVIQRKFRANKLMKQERDNFIGQKNACTMIQVWYRACILRRQNQNNFKAIKKAAIVIQQRFRARKLMQNVRNEFHLQKNSVIKIQLWHRAVVLRRIQQQEFAINKSACKTIQAWYRACKLRQQQQRTFTNFKSACIIIQRRRRANLQMRVVRKEFLQKKKSAVSIQTWYRACTLRNVDQKMFKMLKSYTIVVQRQFRANCLMKTTRKDFLTKKSACVAIQTWYRACLLRKHDQESFNQLKTNAINVQRRFRANILMKKTRQDFELRKLSCIKIQSWYRACVMRNKEQIEFQSLKTSVIFAQRRYRANRMMKLAQSEYVLQRSSCVKIQKWYRACVLCKKQQAEFQSLKQSVIVIQRRYRANELMKQMRKDFLLKKTSSNKIKCYYVACKLRRNALTSYQELRSAVIATQRLYRAHKLMLAAKEDFILKKNSTMKLQCWYRACLLRAVEQTAFKNLKSSAITIQRRLRAQYLMEKTRNEFVLVKVSCIKIQSWHRACRQRQVDQMLYQNLKSSAIVVQRRFRANQLMNSAREEFSLLKISSTRIQAWYRACIQRRIGQTEFLTLKQSATFVQRRFRANKAMKTCHEEFITQKTACVKVQKWYRACTLRRIDQYFFHTLKSSTINLQRRYRANKLMKQGCERFNLMKTSCVSIQVWFRACRLRDQQQTQFKHLKTSVIVVQRQFRAQKLMKIARNEYMRKKGACEAIQSWYRACLLARIERNKFVVLQSSALTIQRKYRATMLMKSMKNDFALKKSSAIKIQTWRRACVLMREIQDQFQRKKSAALVIQTYYHSYVSMKHCHERYTAMVQSARLIQRWYRACKMRDHCRQRYVSLRRTCVFIQSSIKRNKVRSNFQRIKQSCMLVQRWYRATKLREREQGKYKSMKSAALVLQRQYRAHVNKEQCRNEYQQIKSAIISIQQWYRACLHRRTAMNNYRKIKSAVCVLQTRYRAYLLKKETQNLYKRKKAGAIQIQTWYRACVLRNTERDRYSTLKHAVITLQCRYRAYKMKEEAKHEYVGTRMSVIKIQTWYRSCVLRNREQRQFDEIKRAVSIIQAKYRSYCFMRETRTEYNLLRNSAIVIQAYWRRRQARKHFIILKSAVRVIQMRFRATLHAKRERDLYSAKRSSAIVIQSYFRKLLAMKLARQMRAARLIQSTWRMHKQRSLYLQQISSAVVIQASYKGYTHRRKYLSLRSAAIALQFYWRVTLRKRLIQQKRKKAALIIQRNYRRYKLRKVAQEQRMAAFVNNAKIHLAAILLQRCFRNQQALKRMKIEVSSVILLQRWWKACMVRMRFVRMREAVVKIQPIVRRWFTRRTKAAIKVQSVLRVVLSKHAAYKRRWAILFVQSRWRGVMCRKHTWGHAKIRQAQAKCVAANERALENPSMRIGDRTQHALATLLEFKSYSQLYYALQTLEVMSTLHPSCCDMIDEAGGTPVLCRLLGKQNRSVAGEEVHKYTLNILLTLAKNESTREMTFLKLTDMERDTDNKSFIALELLINLLSRFRDQGGRDPHRAPIFCSICELLSEYCSDQYRAQKIATDRKYTATILYVYNDLVERSKKKAYHNFANVAKKQRQSVGYLNQSSVLFNDTVQWSNGDPNTSNLNVSIREMSFIHGHGRGETKSSTPKRNLLKKSSAATAKTTSGATSTQTAARKTIGKLITSKPPTSSAPRIKTSLVSHSGVSIPKMKKTAKAQSPKWVSQRKPLPKKALPMNPIAQPTPQDKQKTIKNSMNTTTKASTTTAKTLSSNAAKPPSGNTAKASTSNRSTAPSQRVSLSVERITQNRTPRKRSRERPPSDRSDSLWYMTRLIDYLKDAGMEMNKKN